MPEQTLTRKRLLAAGAGALGALALPSAVRAAAPAKAPPPPPKQQPVFQLVASGHVCGACRKHDANSFFPTKKAAEGNRAHTGCNCTIAEGSMDFGTFVALFGNPKKLESYRADLRSARTRAVIKNHLPTFPSR